MSDILEINEFFVEGNHPETSHVLLHITEPSTPEEKEKGYFFAVAEMNQADADTIASFQNSISEVENDYYEYEDEPGQTALEKALEKMNATQADAMTRGSSARVHCLIGAVRHREIIFTSTGHPIVLFFYKNKEGSYQTMNMLAADAAQADETAVQPLFNHVLQGKMTPNDYLFIGTPHVGDYFSADRLHKIITTRPSRQSAEHLERVLKELQHSVSFGGLILHLEKKNIDLARPARMAPVKGTSEHSLTSLFSTERSTAHTLSGSFLPRVQTAFYRAGSSMLTSIKKPLAAIPPEEKINTTIRSTHVREHIAPPPPRAAVSSVVWRIMRTVISWIGQMVVSILLVLWDVLRTLVRNFGLIFLVLSNYQNRRHTILENWRRQYRSYRENLRALPRITKILFGLTVILASIFIASIIFLRVNKAMAVAVKTRQNALSAISAKKISAESFLLYGDFEAALREVKDAQKLLAELDCSGKEQLASCQGLDDQLQGVVKKISKIVVVPAAVVFNWPDSTTPLTGLVKLGSKLIAYGSTDEIFVYDLLSKENSKLATNYQTAGFTLASVPKEEDYILFATTAKGLFKFDAQTKSVKKIDVAFPDNNTQLQDIFVYNRRLYSLDSTSKQIYRHDATASGFAQGKEWVTGGSDVGNGQALAIDGDLYLVRADGRMNKFIKGAESPFPIAGLDPALGPKTRIWTYNEITNLYLLDSSNKRLVILDKNGTLKQQVTANEFKHPTGMIIDEKNKQAYVLDGTTVYSINLPI